MCSRRSQQFSCRSTSLLLVLLFCSALLFVSSSSGEQMSEENDDNIGTATADLTAAEDVPSVDKRVPHPSSWRQPGRVRSFHALEMPDFSRRYNRFFDYAQRPLFVRYMRSFAAPGKMLN